ncbi:MAG TPA: hypothetical protein VK386_08935 [Acidimicrobiales bacterium]|nr:hypothetical protein [Acidimicrobiales bacterium]
MTERDDTGLQIPMSAEARRHQNRQMRRAMRKMAEAMGLDHLDPKYRVEGGVQRLWEDIQTAVAGGKMTSPQSGAPPIGDGFGIFVRGVCANGHPPWEQTLVHKCRGGHAYDEHEAREVVEYLKREIADCEQCGEPITTWHSEQQRFSVYAAGERERFGDKVTVGERDQAWMTKYGPPELKDDEE